MSQRINIATLATGNSNVVEVMRILKETSFVWLSELRNTFGILKSVNSLKITGTHLFNSMNFV